MPDASHRPLDVAVVMPVYNGERFLTRVLPPLLHGEHPARVLVVDAGSTDASAVRAREMGAAVVSLPHRVGPARARNVGVDHVDSDVVLFIDADCVAHADVVERVWAAFSADPELVSLTGSYDDEPPEPNFFSQYMNLRHRFFHQRARRDGASFWAGCGAVRREAFVAVGGFDAERYDVPQIEDIELGLRLRSQGHCQLDPQLQVAHLKRWSLGSVVSTDLFQRARPWSRLILERGHVPNDLNVARRQRLAAALAPALLLAPLLAWTWSVAPMLASVHTLALACALVLGADLFAYFWKLRGGWFAMRASLFHQVHLVYSAAMFGYCWLEHLLAPLRRGS